MKIIHRIGIGLLTIAMASAQPLGLAAADRPESERPWALSVSAGGFRPSQSIFRRLYAPLLWPVTVQLHFRPLAHWEAFCGWRYLDASGQTTVSDPEFEEESHAIRLRLHSLRLGMALRLPRRRISPFLGIGVCCHLYQEQWLETPIEASGSQFGLLALTGVSVHLSRRWAIQGSLEYAHVPVERDNAATLLDLGGLDLRLGLALHL